MTHLKEKKKVKYSMLQGSPSFLVQLKLQGNDDKL